MISYSENSKRIYKYYANKISFSNMYYLFDN